MEEPGDCLDSGVRAAERAGESPRQQSTSLAPVTPLNIMLHAQDRKALVLWSS